MGSEHTKVRAGIYVEKEILNQADGLLETANVRSRNEFVAEALKFYIGYLLAGKAENYFCSRWLLCLREPFRIVRTVWPEWTLR